MQVEGIHYDDLIMSFRIMIVEVIRQMQEKPFQEKLLSISETCKTFQPAITRGTLRNWEEAGLINSRSIGGKKFFTLTDILEAGSRIKKYLPGRPQILQAA